MITALILSFALLTSGDLPCPKHIEPIPYPLLARIAHWEGTVTAHVDLDPDGRVTHVTLTGRPIFAEAVENSIKGWRFAGSGKNTADVVFEFKLAGEPREANAETFVTYDLPDRVTVVTQPPVCDHCK